MIHHYFAQQLTFFAFLWYAMNTEIKGDTYMKQDTKKQKIVALRMPLEMYEALSVIAEEDTRSIPNQIRQILREYLRNRAEK